jgi:hypothetical protein
VELHFLAPELRVLDDASAELCVCSIWNDERPIRGLAGLLDWRLGGRLSELLRAGFVSGRRGEALLVPGKPHLPFEKVLVIGLGSRGSFGDEAFREGLLRLARTLTGLRVRRAVVELPGRASESIDPERAITITLECLGDSQDHDAWWLVEAPEAQKRIERRAADERRRVRRA